MSDGEDTFVGGEGLPRLAEARIAGLMREFAAAAFILHAPILLVDTSLNGLTPLWFYPQALFCTFYLLIWFQAHQGKGRAAAWTMSLTLWSGITFELLLSGESVLIIGNALMISILIGAVADGQRGAITMGSLSLISVTGSIVVSLQPGFEPAITMTPVTRWSITVAVMLMVLGILVQFSRELMTSGRTAQHTAEQLRIREELFGLLLENIHEVFWMVDVKDARIDYMSPIGASLVGGPLPPYPSLDAVAARIHPEDLTQVKRRIASNWPDPMNGTIRLRASDDEWRWIHYRAFPIQEQQEIKRIVGVFEDITAQKATEAALEGHRRQLLHAQKMEAIGRLAGGIAHDFNNLLAAVLLNLELSLDAALPEAVTEELSDAREAALRGSRLVAQLLTYSRQHPQNLLDLNLNELVEQTLQMLTPLVGPEVTLVPQLDPNGAFVHADPGQLEQVVANLVLNARDAMAEGGQITIETRTEPRWTTLRVIDTGEGMDAQTLEQATEPFFTTKPPGQGTGLGLSTVLGIVEQTGGALHIDSTPGEGTAVQISLLTVESPQVPAPTRLPSPPPGALQGDILVVDDEPLVQQAVMTALRRSGMTVHQASNSAEAWSKLDEACYDIILCDIRMPG
ncbi:MAG: ATP-binding protein, partial [Myxococcota bacterium]